ncbi:hypothetical protein E2562_014274 [Oryza meyeriana var. granulata]|uniref:Uncharacterized protein n=1 Tax=Oryza meyeriana var. granulata TaxID=110450 RepID=A0A6G1C4S3_9ORYZ|nr:hypothetical protein E2562_014274 [Oryza meyeriana var. granulata]
MRTRRAGEHGAEPQAGGSAGWPFAAFRRRVSTPHPSPPARRNAPSRARLVCPFPAWCPGGRGALGRMHVAPARQHVLPGPDARGESVGPGVGRSAGVRAHHPPPRYRLLLDLLVAARWPCWSRGFGTEARRAHFAA